MIPGKYAAVTGTDYETLFRISKRAVECVFALDRCDWLGRRWN